MFIVRLFQNTRMRWKVLFLVAFFVTLAFVVGLIGMFSNIALKRDLDEMAADYTAIALNITTADALAREMHNIVFTLAFAEGSDASAREHASSYGKVKGEMLQLAARYAEHMINDRRKSATQGLLAQWGKMEPVYESIIDMVLSGNRIIAQKNLTDPNFVREEQLFLNMFAGEADELNGEYQTKLKSVEARADATTNRMIVVLVLVIIAGIFTNILVSLSMTQPLVRLLKSVKILSSGDLAHEIDWYGRDEIAQVGEALTGLVATLNSTIGAAGSTGEHLAEASSDFAEMADATSQSVVDLSGNVDDMTENLRSMADASEEINASVREVSAGAQTTAQKGNEIASMVDEAMAVGSDGMDAVLKVVRGVGEVAQSSSASTGAITELGERARQIQNFVSQIGGIADQTNLLALNAAIEAARAGEAGRGFAVVAEEVRKLAEDSNVAAKNIADLAGTITGELDQIVDSAQDNAKKSSDAVELAGSTEAAIEKMIKILHDISGATHDLAAISEEQAASSTGIAENVHVMADRISKTADTGEHLRSSVADISKSSVKIADNAESLKKMASDLDDELSFFTLGEQKKSDLPALRSSHR